MTRRPRTLTGSPAVPLRASARRLGLDPDDPRRRAAARRFPERWTGHFLALADPADPADPVRRLAAADPAELEPHPLDLADPVGERGVSPVPYVVRKHRDRAILLVTSRCHVYCRFCFRRTFPDGEHRDPSEAALERAIDYLVRDAELREVILSGGDPLVLPTATLRDVVRALSRSPHLRTLRVHTRAPVHDPARVGPALARALTSGLPMWAVLHFAHPREIHPATGRALATLLEAGIPLLDQTVLLGGVNDDPAVLEALFRGLLAERVKPYYLHHPDRVAGAGAFQVGIERGLTIYRELRRRLGGGPALPAYVIDLPDGSGKVPVESLPPGWDPAG